MKVRLLLLSMGLIAIVAAQTRSWAEYTAQNAPDRTADGYPIIWLGNAVEDGGPTSEKDAVPDSFKRIRTTTDNYVRFAKGTDKRAYGCYAGGSPEVGPTSMLEVRGREEAEGVKQTFRVNGWMVTCKKVATPTAAAPSLSSQPAPAPNP